MEETNTILVHLTDLHFGDDFSSSISIEGFSYHHIAKLIASTIKSNHPCEKLIIALGGDVTNKGAAKKYQYAIDFLATLRKELGTIEVDYILCPGNHDIETEKTSLFASFNHFSRELTGGEHFIYNTTNTSVLYNKWGISFVAVNSLYHGNHKFGLVDLNTVEEKLSSAINPIIVLTHHHLIPVVKGDVSTTQNSYDFLRLCLRYDAKLIMHGHIHFAFYLSFGNRESQVDILGCGAPMTKVGTNYNNQFNIIKLNNDVYNYFTYRVIYDSHATHKPEIIKTIL